MKKIITNIVALFFVFVASLAMVPPAPAYAAACKDDNFLLPKWYDDLCDSQGGIKPPSVGGSTNAQTTGNAIGGWLLIIAMNITKILLTIVGYVSIAGIIWGGFKYMLQGDNASGTAGARKTIQNAVIGLVLSILSVAIINFVTGAIAL